MAITPQTIPSLSPLDQNIAALRIQCPTSARHLLDDKPPRSLREATARDGVPTFAWTDDQGHTLWFGRSSMPTIRAVALIDSFQPGTENCLISPFGPGHEFALLLDRLAP